MTLKHILVVNVFFAPYSYGGATIVAEQVAMELQGNHDFRVTAVSAVCRSDIAPYTILKVEKSGVVNYLINLPENRSYAEVYNNPQVDDLIAQLIDTLVPDLLHLHCIQDLGAGIIGVAKGRGLPVVLSVHDFWWLCERQFMIKQNRVYCAQDPIKIDSCKGCVVDIIRAKTRSNYLLKQASMVDILTYPSKYALKLGTDSGLAASKNIVWENGVTLPETGFFERQKKRRRLNPQISFGFVGGPSQIKGWPIIRKAFSNLSRNDFMGYLVDGSFDGDWWTSVDIKMMKGDWKIHPRFSQATMDGFYEKIDVLLFMSQWKETYGLTIREAISRGIKVIQTNSGGTIEHSAAVLDEMLEIGDGPQKLSAQIEKVLNNPSKYPKLQSVKSYGDQAREFINIISPLLN